LTMGR